MVTRKVGCPERSSRMERADTENSFAERNSPEYVMSSFETIVGEMIRLHDRKQKDYGSKKDPFKNVRSSESFGVPGWLGAVIRANDKMTRLKTFALTGSLANESVEDSLIDLANYAVIALVLYREEKQDVESQAMDGGGD